MGINSTGTAYNFGQLGSAYTDLEKIVVPPQGMVICAITFLDTSTPTILTSEKLNDKGPGYVSISGTTTDVVGTADDYMNFHGAAQANCDEAGSVAAGTAISVSATTGTIKVGQAVLLVLDADHEGSGLTIDSETPTPIYSGPNRRGVFVTGIAANGDPILDTTITPAVNQHLIFLGPQQGAGGITAAAAEYPAGMTIYGRWTEFQNSANSVICYFGY